MSTYPKATALVGAAGSVWEGSSALVKIEMLPTARLTTTMAVYWIGPLECVFITDNDIRHIKRGHANDSSLRGQPDVTPEDFAMLPQVLGEFDSCEHADTDKLGNKKFVLTKHVGEVFYVVTIQRGRRKLEVKMMWRRPGASR